MTKEEKVEIKEKLELAISKTTEDIIALKDLTKPISPENSLGRISRMDAINNKSVAEAALRTNEKKLTKMRIALSKIDDEDFGKCELCKQTIPSARIIYMPESNRCVRCADR